MFPFDPTKCQDSGSNGTAVRKQDLPRFHSNATKAGGVTPARRCTERLSVSRRYLLEGPCCGPNTCVGCLARSGKAFPTLNAFLRADKARFLASTKGARCHQGMDGCQRGNLPVTLPTLGINVPAIPPSPFGPEGWVSSHI